MFISWRGTQRRVRASYPGELNVFYLKAQDGIKDVAGGFTTRQHKHLVLFSQSTECQGWIRIVMLLILMFGSHAPGTELTRSQAGCVGPAGTVSAVGLMLPGRGHSASHVVTSPSLRALVLLGASSGSHVARICQHSPNTNSWSSF